MGSPLKPYSEAEIAGLEPRSQVLAYLKNNWLAVRNGVYSFVKRGPVNWSAFPFDRHPRAVSINVDESDLYSRAQEAGTQTMILSMEIMAQMETAGGKDGSPWDAEFDDGLLDQMFTDTKKVVNAVLDTRSPLDPSMPVAIRRHERSDRSVEAQNVNWGVQGLIITLRLDY